MKNNDKPKLEINTLDDLLSVDENFQFDNVNLFEKEVKTIVDSLWSSLSYEEKFIKPFFLYQLQTKLLTQLYISYFSLLNISKKKNITIKASHTIFDLVANYLEINLDENRNNYDHFFAQVLFPYQHQKIVSKIASKFRFMLLKVRGKLNLIDVLYINAGKLSKDFRKCYRSVDATSIPQLYEVKDRIDVDNIISKSIKKIEKLNISIPKILLINFLNKFVYGNLVYLIGKTLGYADFIKANKVKLVIVSSGSHNSHLALLAAANLSNIKSLVVGHGFSPYRKSISHINTLYDATISPLEDKIPNSKSFNLRMLWFDEKSI